MQRENVKHVIVQGPPGRSLLFDIQYRLAEDLEARARTDVQAQEDETLLAAIEAAAEVIDGR